MREHNGLTVEQACAVWIRMIDRSLPPTPATLADAAWSSRLRIVVIDGRRLRSERTRQHIIEAYIALLREDPRSPTAARSPSARLFGALAVRALSRPAGAQPRRRRLWPSPRPTRRRSIRNVTPTAPTRIRTQVETRAQTCEQWLPLWRALIAQPARFERAASSASQRVREAILARLELMYRPELDTLERDGAPAHPDRARGDHRLRELGADARDGRPVGRGGLQVWIRVIDSLLPPTPVS